MSTRFTLRALAGSVLAAALLFGAGLPDVAMAQQDPQQGKKEETRRTPALREQTFKKLEEAQGLIDAKNYTGALGILNAALTGSGMNGYELAQIYNMIAFTNYTIEKMPEAIRAYEMVLKQGENIPVAMEVQTIYTLSQLYFVQENYTQALQYLERWFKVAENPNANAYIFKAQIHYQASQFAQGVQPTLTAIEMAKAKGEKPPESTWLLLRAFYFELENWPKVLEVMEILVTDYPIKDHWVQLAGIYGQQEMEDKQLAALFSAYVQGYFEDEREFMNLAGLMMQNDVSYRAGAILREGFAQKKIERTSKNLQMLGQAWQMAKEADYAAPVLEEAGKLAESGEIYYRLASVYMDQDQFDKCITAADNAVRKGGLRNPADAHVVRGMCQYNKDDLNDALKTFREARKVATQVNDKSSQRIADQWIGYLEKETERQRQLEASI